MRTTWTTCHRSCQQCTTNKLNDVKQVSFYVKKKTNKSMFSSVFYLFFFSIVRLRIVCVFDVVIPFIVPFFLTAFNEIFFLFELMLELMMYFFYLLLFFSIFVFRWLICDFCFCRNWFSKCLWQFEFDFGYSFKAFRMISWPKHFTIQAKTFLFYSDSFFFIFLVSNTIQITTQFFVCFIVFCLDVSFKTKRK